MENLKIKLSGIPDGWPNEFEVENNKPGNSHIPDILGFGDDIDRGRIKRSSFGIVNLRLSDLGLIPNTKEIKVNRVRYGVYYFRVTSQGVYVSDADRTLTDAAREKVSSVYAAPVVEKLNALRQELVSRSLQKYAQSLFARAEVLRRKTMQLESESHEILHLAAQERIKKVSLW